MKKIIIVLLIINFNYVLHAQSVYFVTDGAVGKDGQVFNVPDSPLSKKVFILQLIVVQV